MKSIEQQVRSLLSSYYSSGRGRYARQAFETLIDYLESSHSLVYGDKCLNLCSCGEKCTCTKECPCRENGQCSCKGMVYCPEDNKPLADIYMLASRCATACCDAELEAGESDEEDLIESALYGTLQPEPGSDVEAGYESCDEDPDFAQAGDYDAAAVYFALLARRCVNNESGVPTLTSLIADTETLLEVAETLERARGDFSDEIDAILTEAHSTIAAARQLVLATGATAPKFSETLTRVLLAKAQHIMIRCPVFCPRAEPEEQTPTRKRDADRVKRAEAIRGESMARQTLSDDDFIDNPLELLTATAFSESTEMRPEPLLQEALAIMDTRVANLTRELDSTLPIFFLRRSSLRAQLTECNSLRDQVWQALNCLLESNNIPSPVLGEDGKKSKSDVTSDGSDECVEEENEPGDIKLSSKSPPAEFSPGIARRPPPDDCAFDSAEYTGPDSPKQIPGEKKNKF